MPALPRPRPALSSAARPLSLGTVMLLAASQIACAHPRATTPDEARLVRLEVVDRDTGAPLPQHRHRREAWVVGEHGQPYTLRLRNQTAARVLVVLSVDGINVVTGESADPSQSGYVLAPYASAEIDGWRKSMQEVAAFRFSAAGDSYAARTGRPFDLGVIGAAVFREAEVVEPWPMPAPPVAQRERSAPSAGAAEAVADAAAGAHAPTSPLGTAHGERRWSPSARTRFERASPHAEEIIALRYDRPAALVARGVIRVGREPWPAREPRAFPGGFVPDP